MELVKRQMMSKTKNGTFLVLHCDIQFTVGSSLSQSAHFFVLLFSSIQDILFVLLDGSSSQIGFCEFDCKNSMFGPQKGCLGQCGNSTAKLRQLPKITLKAQ